jgi:excisionase family DNA binding protein
VVEALTLRAVAARLQVSDRQVRRFVADRRDPLPVLRLGPRSRRVAVADLEAWCARRRETAVAVEPGLFAGFSDEARAALESLFLRDDAGGRSRR